MSHAISIDSHWSQQGPSFRMDIICLCLALALHAPLIFMKLDFKKKSVDRAGERLVSIDLIDPEAPKPVAPPAPKVKSESIFSKLKALVQNEPPKPKVEKALEPKKIDLAPKKIDIDPTINKINPTINPLQSKAGFKTAANPNLVKEKSLSLKDLNTNIAPLSSKRLGIETDRTKIKDDKGSFKVSKSESLTAIGGGPGILDASAPTIAINAGQKGSVEKFSAPAPVKANKGNFQGGAGASLGGNEKLSLRDSIIARDAAPAAIGAIGTSATGSYSGVVATKKDAGSFQSGSETGNVLAKPGANVGSLASAKTMAPIIQKKKVKKEMFSITGPLKDRNTLHKEIPEYPGWAQAKGIEAAVVLEFTVNPDGIVKNSIVVRRTSGYPELDKSAIDAIKKWKFAPLADVNRDEVGLITFNYSLS